MRSFWGRWVFWGEHGVSSRRRACIPLDRVDSTSANEVFNDEVDSSWVSQNKGHSPRLLTFLTGGSDQVNRHMCVMTLNKFTRVYSSKFISRVPRSRPSVDCIRLQGSSMQAQLLRM
jgi:hypothetical protein